MVQDWHGPLGYCPVPDLALCGHIFECIRGLGQSLNIFDAMMVRLIPVVLFFFIQTGGLAQVSSVEVPMSTRMALSELSALVEVTSDLDKLYAEASGQYPVARMHGRLMVGFVGRVHENGTDIEAMAAMGPEVYVGAQCGGILSFRVDIQHLNRLEDLELLGWQMASKAAPDLEKARYGTRTDSVHAGLGLPQAFTGEDVLIGVVDWGFDYTHPMFLDTALTASRIRGVWDQFRTGGPTPEGFDYGRVGETPEDLVAMGSDTANVYSYSYHGTHVGGIAAGGGAGTELIGMAPAAELLFATFLVDESAAMDAFAWMQDVAEADGKRLVINMSWSLPQFGTRDGLGMINQFINAMSEEGVVFVGSGGNNGDSDFHLAHAFAGDTLRSKVQFYPESAHPSMWGQNLTMWGEPGESFEAGFMLTELGTQVAQESPWFSTSSGPLMLDSILVQDGDTILFDLVVEDAHPDNGRPYLRLRIRKGTSSLGVALQLHAPQGLVHAWNVTHLSNGVGNWGQNFQSNSSGWVAGDPEYGVSIPANTESVIAVGAYYSEYLNPVGNEGGGTLANFSTLGPTIDGRTKPDISAPGVSVESSISSFTDANYNMSESVEFEGVTYPFARLSGTSMSGPAVAGIAALLLEANPSLSPFEVKETLKATAREDNYTGDIPVGGSPVWGWGKVNAIQAVMGALGIQSAPSVGNGIRQGIQVWPNPVRDVVHLEVTPSGTSCVWTALDLTGREMAAGKAGSSFQIDASQWPVGAFLLKVEAEGGMVQTFRLVKG